MGARGRVLLALDLNSEAVETSYDQRLTGTRNRCGSLPVNEDEDEELNLITSLSLCALVVMEIYRSWCARRLHRPIRARVYIRVCVKVRQVHRLFN